jgi:large subunit ribosomal protein L32
VAVPKRRNPRARRNARRANHDKVSQPSVIECPNCGELMMPHRMCPACGHYNGREVVAMGEEASE